MSRRVAQHAAVAAIAERVARAPGRTVLIGIDGYGGAGKSSFAARVHAALPGAALVHIDDFAAPSVPEWDWDRFRAQVLLPLLAGRPGHYQRWDWHTDSGAEWHDVPVGRPVIVEGVSATRREVGASWAVTIWVDTPREERLRRARDRDGPELMPTWLGVWLPSEQAYVAREDPVSRVDLVVSGTEPRGDPPG